MSYSHERSSIFPYLLTGIVAFNLGSLLVRLTTEGEEEIKDDIRNAQMYNHQLQQELTQTFSDVEELEVRLNGKTFGFVNGSETCNGQYEVTEEVAYIAGNVACTTQVAPGSVNESQGG